MAEESSTATMDAPAGAGTDPAAEAALDKRLAEVTGTPYMPTTKDGPAKPGDAPQGDTDTDPKADPAEDPAARENRGDDADETASELKERTELSRRQKAAAKAYGISDEQIQAMGDGADAVLDQLAIARTAMSKQKADLDEREAALVAGANTDSPEDGSGDDPNTDDPTTGSDPVDEGALDTALDDLDSWADPAEAAKAIAKVVSNALSKGEIARLREANKALETKFAAFMKQTTDRWNATEHEHFFAGLDPKTYEMYGTGLTADMDPASPESESRAELIAQAQVLRRGAAFGPGHPEVPWSKAMSQALLLKHPGRSTETDHRRDVEDPAVDDPGQVTGRSGSRQTRTGQTPAEAAAEALEKKLAGINQR